MTQPHLLDRRQGASTYLKDKWGVSYTPNTLNKMAHEGGGPRYVTVGGRAFYTRKDLDAWIIEKMRVCGSTSDEGKAATDIVRDLHHDSHHDDEITEPVA